MKKVSFNMQTRDNQSTKAGTAAPAPIAKPESLKAGDVRPIVIGGTLCEDGRWWCEGPEFYVDPEDCNVIHVSEITCDAPAAPTQPAAPVVISIANQDLELLAQAASMLDDFSDGWRVSGTRTQKEDLLRSANAVRRLAKECLHAQSAAPSLTQAARDVLAERQRQISSEGWTTEHDEHHTDDSLALASAWYAIPERTRTILDKNHVRFWPISWTYQWFKSGDRRKELVKSGALILAELERMDRAKAKKGGAE